MPRVLTSAQKIAFVALGACFVGIIATSVSFSIAPAVLGVEAVLCPDEGRFVTHEGPTVMLPDGQAVAPETMRCVAADGGESEPNLFAAGLTHLAAWLVLSVASIALALRWLMRAPTP